MIKLYAQPYDISANGFYFSSLSEYVLCSQANVKPCGQLVEEYELQFIDGELIDAELAKAWGLNQANFAEYLIRTQEWDTRQKQIYIIAISESGYDHAQMPDDPYDFDIDIYELDSLKELAEQFVDEGLFGEIPERIQFYLDYDAIARDLGFDYSETNIDNTNLIYRLS